MFKIFKKTGKIIWLGRCISILCILPFIFSAYMKFFPNLETFQGMAHLGIPSSLLTLLGILETICIILYALPKTSVLGAILFTGYLGGAICIHLRISENVYLQIALGIFIWLGIYLRDNRLQNLIPIRRAPHLI